MARRAAQQRPMTQPTSINKFLKVSKGSAVGGDLALVAKKEATDPAVIIKTPTSRKRKASSDEEPRSTRSSSSSINAQAAKRSCQREETFQHVAQKITLTTKPRKSKVATSRLEKIRHKSTATTVISNARREGRSASSRVDKLHVSLAMKSRKATLTDLPAEFVELMDLHRTFLKTVHVQLAHNGTSVPIDLCDILPHVSRAWGKRKVTVEDVRRCIAVEDHGAGESNTGGSPFILSDYGQGKICLELDSKHTGTPINADRLCKVFRKNLEDLNTERNNNERNGSEMDLDIPMESLSLGDLPKAPINTRVLAMSSNPLLARGQRALTELKNVVATKQQVQQQEREAKLQLAATTHSQDCSKMSILDRIRLKQLAKAQQPVPPSPAELERRAALQRVGDVAAIISMLARSSHPCLPRQAYPMAVLQQRLKDSLRMPISKQESAACIRLIANEVAPEWLKVVTIGGKETVVVTQGQNEPSVTDITERANNLS